MDIDLQDKTGAFSTVSVWNHEADDRVLCVDVHDETHDVRTFTFVSTEGKHFAFRAGQYFMFEPDIDDEENGRCYSISSSPVRRNAFTITVKRVPGGKVSNWMHEELKPGMTIKATGPLGRFVRPEGRKLLLLSGGSGITPVMSMTRDLADIGEPIDVVFLHAGRTPQDFIFRRELESLAQRVKGLRLQFLPETSGQEKFWSSVSGRISKEFLTLAVPDIAERTVMCCGPALFMKVARSLALELGVSEVSYFEESFDVAPIGDAPATAQSQIETKSYSVQFAKQSKTIEVRTDQTVLSVAKKAGIRIPSSCANGICGTCKSKLLSGKVDMNHDGGIRQREIDSGLFLPCCSKPLSDIIIDR